MCFILEDMSTTMTERRWQAHRAREDWWAAYSDALAKGADMAAWLDEHPFPGSPEVADRVRIELRSVQRTA